MTSFDAIAAQFPFSTKGQAAGIDSPATATNGKSTEFSLEFSALTETIGRADTGATIRPHSKGPVSTNSEQQPRAFNLPRDEQIVSAEMPTVTPGQIKAPQDAPSSAKNTDKAWAPGEQSNPLWTEQGLPRAAEATSSPVESKKNDGSSKDGDQTDEVFDTEHVPAADTQLEASALPQSDPRSSPTLNFTASEVSEPHAELDEEMASFQTDKGTDTAPEFLSHTGVQTQSAMVPQSAVAPMQDSELQASEPTAQIAFNNRGFASQEKAPPQTVRPDAQSSSGTSATPQPDLPRQSDVYGRQLTAADETGTAETVATADEPATLQPASEQRPEARYTATAAPSVSEARFALHSSTASFFSTPQNGATSGQIALPDGMEEISENAVALPIPTDENVESDPALRSEIGVSVRNISQPKVPSGIVTGQTGAISPQETQPAAAAPIDIETTDSTDTTTITSTVNTGSNTPLQTSAIPLQTVAQAQLGAEKYVTKRRELSEQLDEELTVTQIGKDRTAQSRMETAYAVTSAASTTMSNGASGQSLPAESGLLAQDQPTPIDEDSQRFGLAPLPSHTGMTAATTASQPAAQQAMAQNVSQQLARAATSTSDGAVELTLAPEELGKVRMVMHHSDSGMSVMIYADRPETLDLMRRHAEMLSRDLRELGYTDVNLNFTDQGQSGQNAQELAEQADRIRAERGTQAAFSAGSISNTLNPSRTSGSVLGGLDLRM
ncbi:flagellar hook-length control protein FliK [Thioclava kandeliae]|uniref:Flagellar hook-length control protein FliK n=1 Tax=Thioclava kandeliae TaxID=3070818 RepID=A0ABV1SLR9_9RHOB